jgi:photosystem II stability/assembly factor-like uncharacterized protein
MNGLLKYDLRRAQWVSAGFAGKAILSVTGLPAGAVWVTVQPPGSDTTSAVAYVSEDGGTSWQGRDGGLSASVGYHGMAISFAYQAAAPAHLYMGLSGSIVRSLDGGGTWTYAYGGSGDYGLGISAILASSADSARMWAGGEDGAQSAFVLRSDDGGGSWQRLNPTQSSFDGNSVRALASDPQSASRVFLGMASAVWVTDDAGASWRVAVPTARPGWVTGLAYNGSNLIATADEFATTSGSPVSVCGVYTSSNGGTTWDTLPVPASAAGARALYAGAGGVLLIGTESGLWMVAPE